MVPTGCVPTVYIMHNNYAMFLFIDNFG